VGREQEGRRKKGEGRKEKKEKGEKGREEKGRKKRREGAGVIRGAGREPGVASTRNEEIGRV
jgi:hypothetical protein